MSNKERDFIDDEKYDDDDFDDDEFDDDSEERFYEETGVVWVRDKGNMIWWKDWWKDEMCKIGIHIFSFDKKKEFNLFRDYPWALTDEEKEIFDRENPYWAEFFSDRQSDK